MASSGKKGTSLTEEERKQYKETFDSLDTNKDGQITVDDLKAFMKKVGHELPDGDLKAFIDLADNDNSGSVSWEEFLQAIHEGISPGNQMKARCRLVYSEFDKDGTGYVTKEQIKQVVKDSPDHASVTDADIDRAVAELDKDGDGRVSFEEFLSSVSKALD